MPLLILMLILMLVQMLVQMLIQMLIQMLVQMLLQMLVQMLIQMRLYASYKAENWSIHIKIIICNVWNRSKPFKIASNRSCDIKNTPKSSNMFKKKHKNQFLQYQSTRIFTNKKKSDNQIIDLYRKTCVSIKHRVNIEAKIDAVWGPLLG